MTPTHDPTEHEDEREERARHRPELRSGTFTCLDCGLDWPEEEEQADERCRLDEFWICPGGPPHVLADAPRERVYPVGKPTTPEEASKRTLEELERIAVEGGWKLGEDEREERRRNILLNLQGDLEKLTRGQAIHKLEIIREFLGGEFVYAKGAVVRSQSIDFPCTTEELRDFVSPPSPLDQQDPS